MIQLELEIKNPSGLHARPATLLCDLCQEFECDLSLEYNGNSIEPRSILNILCAGIPVGSTVTLIAQGDDEEEAASAIAKLVSELDE